MHRRHAGIDSVGRGTRRRGRGAPDTSRRRSGRPVGAIEDGPTGRTALALSPSDVLELQRTVGNQTVCRLVAPTAQRRSSGAVARPVVLVRPAATPAVQRTTAFELFNSVLKRIVQEMGKSSLSDILGEMATKNKLDPNDAEQNIAFGSAWKGKDPNSPPEKDKVESGDDRVMLENLIQSGFYNIGAYLTSARMSTDQATLFGKPGEKDPVDLYDAFRKALFYRGERIDSNANKLGYLKYDPKKHGKSGSASDMPGKSAKEVAARADGYLFVSKSGQEAKGYVTKAQGGKRELLVIVASKTESDLMLYDVDSNGYKTKEMLTGIVDGAMTQTAVDNLNTWLAKEKQVSLADDKKLLDEMLLKITP